MANFAHFTLLPIFSHQSGVKWFRTPILVSLLFSYLFLPKWSKWFGMPNFDCSTLFPILSNQSGMKYPILIFFFFLEFFQSFPAKMVEMSPKKCCATIKTDKKLSWWILNQSALNFQNRAQFSEPVKMSPRSPVLWSLLNKNNFPVGFQYSWEILLYMAHSVLL